MDVVLKLNGCPLVSPTYNDLMDAGRDYFATGENGGCILAGKERDGILVQTPSLT